jgi:hypothetical protein
MSARWLVNLMGRSHRKQALSEIYTVISGLERQAPSGLKPLWIGLLLFTLFMLALYASA